MTPFNRRGALAALICLAVTLPVAWGAVGAPTGARSVPALRIALVEAFSGPLANTGDMVHRNLVFAIERVNARGGVQTPGGARDLVLERFDSKGDVEEAIARLRGALDDGIRVIAQGNSSAVAEALVGALDRHNAREPHRQALLLNYSAVDPALTNEKCSYWHFRFDAHAAMRMSALMELLEADRGVREVYLIGQDYSFGREVLREARQQLSQRRPDVRIAGETLHPLARVKDFMPYAVKIKASGAQAVITGNWGNDLALLVRAAREVGYTGRFYTFYGNSLGAPAAIGDAGAGRVIAVAEWFPNVASPESAAFYESFRRRFARPEDDYLQWRMVAMIEALVQAVERAGAAGHADPSAREIAAALEGAEVMLAGRRLTMRAADHQAQQPLVVSVMDRKGMPGVVFDVEGSGYGFRVLRELPAAAAQQPHRCRMPR